MVLGVTFCYEIKNIFVVSEKFNRRFLFLHLCLRITSALGDGSEGDFLKGVGQTGGKREVCKVPLQVYYLDDDILLWCQYRH
jgi:hypothetical protein